jgi:hypothetical protein
MSMKIVGIEGEVFEYTLFDIPGSAPQASDTTLLGLVGAVGPEDIFLPFTQGDHLVMVDPFVGIVNHHGFVYDCRRVAVEGDMLAHHSANSDEAHICEQYAAAGGMVFTGCQAPGFRYIME